MSSFQEKMTAAREQFDNEQYQEASKTYLDALSLSPSNRDAAIAWAEISINFYRMRSWDRAIEAAENVLSYDPEYGAREDIYRTLGFSYLALADMESAQSNLEKSIQIDSHSDKQILAVYELGKLYFRQQKYEQAKTLFDQIDRRLEETYRDYWLSMLFFQGFIAYYGNRLEQSRDCFQKLLNIAPDNKQKASAIFGLSFLTFADKDFLKTINLCESVLEYDPEFFDKETIGFLTAASFHNLGRNDIFEKYYDQLMRNYPDGRYAGELQRLKEKGSPQQ